MCFLAFLMTVFTVVELNCENLFDTLDNGLKQDEEFLPASSHHWTASGRKFCRVVCSVRMR